MMIARESPVVVMQRSWSRNLIFFCVKNSLPMRSWWKIKTRFQIYLPESLGVRCRSAARALLRLLVLRQSRQLVHVKWQASWACIVSWARKKSCWSFQFRIELGGFYNSPPIRLLTYQGNYWHKLEIQILDFNFELNYLFLSSTKSCVSNSISPSTSQ